MPRLVPIIKFVDFLYIIRIISKIKKCIVRYMPCKFVFIFVPSFADSVAMVTIIFNGISTVKVVALPRILKNQFLPRTGQRLFGLGIVGIIGVTWRHEKKDTEKNLVNKREYHDQP